MLTALRLLALLTLLAFALAVVDPLGDGYAEMPATTATAELSELPPDAAATRALAAAALAGPRAIELELRAALPDPELPTGPLGAQVVAELPPLPFAPAAIELRALRRPAVGRPLPLELRCAAPAADVPPGLVARVQVRDGDFELLAETVPLTADAAAALELVPTRAGPLGVRIEVELGDHRIVCTGEIAVDAPDRVLVLEPSGIAAAALSAQGIRVERADAMRADLSDYAAVVVGAPLVASVQDAIAAAVGDGLGLFVLAPGFGAAQHPIRALLPLRPEPVAGASDSGGAGAVPGESAGAANGPVGGAGAQPPPASTAGAPSPADLPDRPITGPIERPSPVSNEPIEVDKRTIALVLVVDRSWSMGEHVRGGRSKMSYAKTSALQSARALAAGDEVGIVTFGGKDAGRVELGLTDAGATATIAAGVERLAHAAENTFLLSGLQRAEELLRGADTAIKHIVVITDGEFQTSETFAMRALAHRMFANEKISLSILSIVSPDTPPGFMSDATEITRDGGGEFFAIEAAESVPVFVSAEVTRSLDRVGRQPGGPPNPNADPANQPSDPEPATPTPPPDPPESEPPPPEREPPAAEPEPRPEPPARLQVRAVARSPVLEPVPVGDWPTLAAAVPTTAPLDAQVLLVAGEQGWPLLCFGNRGLGRVGAFAADLCGDAGAEFRRDPEFPARLALWVQDVLRAEPVFEPAVLALAPRVEPRAPTPAEIAALEGLGGAAMQREAAPPSPAIAREVRSLVPEWAFGALALVVLLALAERFAVLRGKLV